MIIQLDVLLAIRVGYLSAGLAVLMVSVIAPLRRRFLAYGARASPLSSSASSKSSAPRDERVGFLRRCNGAIDAVLDQAATLQVPHNWFTSFYAVSVGSSLFWAGELIVKGPIFRRIAENTSWNGSTMTFSQVRTVWVLMLVQGSRRLYECLVFSKPSQSQMWIGHWIVGIAFYLVTGVAVWIEGISIKDHRFSLQDIGIVAPSVRSFIGILLFILASGFQHDCHVYLASLKNKPRPKNEAAKPSNYQVPAHPAFHNLIAPHYTAECLIYTALAVIAAPSGAWVNWTFLCGLIFVTINLGVTARTTRQWYEEKFGPTAVAGKWSMLPGLL